MFPARPLVGLTQIYNGNLKYSGKTVANLCLMYSASLLLSSFFHPKYPDANIFQHLVNWVELIMSNGFILSEGFVGRYFPVFENYS